jgi:anti-sigma regulatory factor (Ser/Thr protein kinase)
MRWFAVRDRTAVGEARRLVRQLAREAGLDAVDEERAAIVVTEAATNILRHAGGGEMLLRRAPRHDGPGVWIVAADRGPGIGNLDLAMQDGYSTAGSAGTGLGGMERQSDMFDIYSTAASGTIVTARVERRQRREERPSVDVAGLMLPYPDEEECGDGWAARPTASGMRVMLCDGLGHGRKAREASAAAEAAFESADDSLEAAAERIEMALAETRGAVALLCDVPAAGGELRYTGRGNIAGYVWERTQTKRLMGRDGHFGAGSRRTHHTDALPFGEGATLVLASDGLKTIRDLSPYPGLAARDPLTIAALLLRELPRGNDDVAVLVARRRR